MGQQSCYCGSGKKFNECCEPILSGSVKAKTAEQLMRSRYTAYVLAKIDFLKQTLAPESRSDFDETSTRQWSKQAEWLGLEILSVQNGLETDKKGTVEFMAKYKYQDEVLEHHEVSQFRKTDSGDWFFIDGEGHTHKEGETHTHHAKPQTVVREQAKIGRNDPCSCGSGKKYKKCCGVNA